MAVAEPDRARRERFAAEHGIPPERCFASWQDLLARPQLARALVNATMDRNHVASTLAALAAGYDVLLEKPMATTPDDCVRLVRAAEASGRLLQICHVMRYTLFWGRLHEILQSGRLARSSTSTIARTWPFGIRPTALCAATGAIPTPARR